MCALKVAIGSLFTECNQLGGTPIDIAAFERYELRRGNAILELDEGSVGGMLNVLKKGSTELSSAEPSPVELVPLICASTCPGGYLTSECYHQLKSELIDRLKSNPNIDGVLLALHGAAMAEDVPDLEGDLLKAIRLFVGEKVPIVAALDLHAHVTAEMIHHADALLAWETYPHRDAYTTGERCARLLLAILAGKCSPKMAMAKVPLLTGGIKGSTEGDDPLAHIMRFTKSQENRSGVLSTSLFMVHAYLDQAAMGSGGLVITDNDIDLAVSIAREIADILWTHRFNLEPEVHTPIEAIRRGLAVEGGPILLVETADCCGGGAAGDSVATLRALLEADIQVASLLPVVDPESAALCHQAGIGKELTVSLGHKLDPRWGNPITITGKVTHLSNGRFRYSGGIWHGIEGDMGPSAVLTKGSIQVLISSCATYDWRDEQFRSCQLDPTKVKFVVAKNPMNYRLAYADIAKAIFVLDTPGPTPATIRHIHYKHLKRPYFPLDEHIPGYHPAILRRRMNTFMVQK